MNCATDLSWRVLIQDKLDPALNMAVDEVILDGVLAGTSSPTIRFYDWEPATLSCGYGQNAEKEVNFGALDRLGYGFIRRPTGGRTVLHKDEITYSVIAPLGQRFAGGVEAVYLQVSRALAWGLHKIGVPVDLERGHLSAAEQRQVANPCFASTSRYELAVEGKKICGSAQLRRETAFLQHGSLLWQVNQEEAALVLNTAKPDKMARILAASTICVNQVLNRDVPRSELLDALVQGFRECWREDVFSLGTLTDFEFEQAHKMIGEKYSRGSWNLAHGNRTKIPAQGLKID